MSASVIPKFKIIICDIVFFFIYTDVVKLLLEHPMCKTYVTLGDRAFKAATPTLWNELPIHIRNSESLSSFKNLLKTHIFKLSF